MSASTLEATSIAQVDTEYSADSIEFCPNVGFEDVFVCGTYQLLKPEASDSSAAKDKPAASEEEQKSSEDDEDDDDDVDSLVEEKTPPAPRVGRLYLFNLDGETPVEKQRIETAAILDSKWNPSASTPELGVADAKGGLTVYSLATPTSTFEQVQKLAVADEETLVLSLDWHRTGKEVMTSLSSGELAHLVRDDTGELTVSSQWAAHDFEPWITAWDGTDLSTAWSGGDDLRLKRWDVRCALSTLSVRGFDGGVTTIAPSPHAPHLLAVGSYDARLRIFDVRSPRTPLSETEMPGGIWRTRWHPSPERKGDILNACMHGGFAVVRVPEDGAEGEIIRTFPGTLGYGADWCRRSSTEDSIVATCSFYDHVMHVWRA